MNSLTRSALLLVAIIGTVAFAGPPEITRIEPAGAVIPPQGGRRAREYGANIGQTASGRW